MKLKNIPARTIRTAAGEAPEKSTGGTVPGAAVLLLSAFAGFLAAGTKLGGNGAPLCVSIAAALSPMGGISAFAGAMIRFFAAGSVISRATEIAAMPAAIAVRALLARKKLSPAASGALALAAYIVCGLAAALVWGASAALVMAIIFRGIIAGAAAYFASDCFSRLKTGGGLSAEAALPAAVTYILIVCMLGGVSLGTFNPGRIAGGFVILAAAYRYGFGGGAAAGALSAFAVGMASPSMTTTAAVTVCGGLSAGFFRGKSKLGPAAAFIITVLAGALFYGMPTGAAGLLADSVTAAALFYLVPERLWSDKLRGITSKSSAASEEFSCRLRFAAGQLSDIRESFGAAAEVLEKSAGERDIPAMVCNKVCTGCKSGAYCGETVSHRKSAYFRPVEEVLRDRGFVTEKDLPDGLEHCPRKRELLNAFNEGYRLCRLTDRLEDRSRSMRELAVEQLQGTEEMLRHLSMAENFVRCDEELSRRISDALSELGLKSPAAAAFFDGKGRLFIECFFRGEQSVKTDAIRDKLREISGREPEEPVSVPSGELTRLRFCQEPEFEAEIGRAAVSGGGETSGDSDAVFRDGFGNVYILLSDGMGRGVRAAVESRMTVSVMTRAIKAGLGPEAAVKLANGLLTAKSPEEYFATADMLRINLFTGRAELLKMGAAQTFIKMSGAVRTVESRTTPLGIVDASETDRRSVQLVDGDGVVMITDGITEDCFPRVRELMLSMGVTAQDIAERIIAEAEKDKETSPAAQDDKTVVAVKIHRL